SPPEAESGSPAITEALPNHEDFRMTTFWEETTSLHSDLTRDTASVGAMPVAQKPRTFHGRIPGRDDPNRADPRRHVHRPDPRHDFHRPDPRRHDQRL